VTDISDEELRERLMTALDKNCVDEMVDDVQASIREQKDLPKNFEPKLD